MVDIPRIFVGSDPNGSCAENQMVFEYSLRKHASGPIELIWMQLSDDPSSFWYGWNTENYSTPFSAFRYGIPAYCGYKGKAIYCDDDQLWLSDVYNLWNQDVSNHVVLSKGPHMPDRYCVALWNCKLALQYFPMLEDLRNHPTLYKNLEAFLAYHYVALGKKFDGDWNNFDGEDRKIEDIDLVHYTNMATNPGIALARKRLGAQPHWYDGPIEPHRRKDIEKLFYDTYEEAIDSGYKISDYIPSKRIEFGKKSQAGYKANNGWD